ncbi:MAG: ketoacyl-ACP synthase III [Desulfatibacillaceae bacterium]|nr:ketoacyl-ACP synthase III [Desulfatibacillaceae bacterium]
MGIRSHIRAISAHLPEKVLDNAALCRQYPNITPEHILKHTGVAKRHVSAPRESGPDLAGAAAKKLLAENSIAPDEVDYLLLCSMEPDHKAPSTACLWQHRLGIPTSAGALEFNLGCSGFIYGLSLAKGLVETGQARSVLLAVGEAPTKVIHPEDVHLAVLFGDGGGAALISAAEEKSPSGIGSFVLGTDGSATSIRVRGGAGREHADQEWIDKYKAVGGLPWGRMEMDGMAVLRFVLATVPGLVAKTLEKNGLGPDDIDLYIFHQANGFVLNTLCRKMGIKKERFFSNIQDCGNTICATIPIAMSAALAQGRIRRGDRLLLAGFGVGHSWGATVVTW